MSVTKFEEEIQNKINEKLTEYERYYQTVILTLGIKDFLDTSNNDCRFVTAEPILKTEDNTELNPDFILQYDKDNFGIMGEIKTSIPNNDEYFEKNDLIQIKKYCKTVIGWDTKNRLVKDHELLILNHFQNSTRMQYLLNKYNTQISKVFCLAEYSSFRSFKVGQGDIILIKHKYGNLDVPFLLDHLKNDISIEIDKIQGSYETCRFTRREPPIEYLMDQLWLFIFPFFVPQESFAMDFQVDIDIILDLVQNYYLPWTGLHEEYKQVRLQWVKKAMDKFVEIGLAKRDPKNPDKFLVLYGKKGVSKNIKQYIIKQCAIKEIKKITKKKRVAKGQTQLIK